MKAAVFYQCGDASQIQIADVPMPQVGPGQALIRVHASAFNHLELWSLHGPADESYHFPMWTGSDISGVIEQLAPDVSGWTIGEAVVVNPSLSCGKCPRCLEGEVSQCDDYDILGSAGNGGNAEYVVADADKLMRMPPGFDFVLAAAAPLAYQTAWRALVKRAKVQPGEDVLVLGASGGVAVAAIQISRMIGARVFAVTSSPKRRSKSALPSARISPWTAKHPIHLMKCAASRMDGAWTSWSRTWAPPPGASRKGSCAKAAAL